MKDKLFSLEGTERFNLIKSMTIDERDEVCESFRDCKLCPMAVIYCGRPICAEVSTHFRIRRLLERGYKFTSAPEVSDE